MPCSFGRYIGGVGCGYNKGIKTLVKNRSHVQLRIVRNNMVRINRGGRAESLSCQAKMFVKRYFSRVLSLSVAQMSQT